MLFRKFLLPFFIAFQILIATGCTGNSENNGNKYPENASPNSTGMPIEYADVSVSQSINTSVAQGEELFVFRKNGKDGFTNMKGEWVLQPIYELAYPFIEGLALVKLDGKLRLINLKGEPIPMPEGVTEISTFKGGLAPVTINGKTGFINRQGKIVTEPILNFNASSIALPSEGMRMVVIDSLFTFIDSTGKIIRQPGFEYALDFYEGYALVSNQGRYGYLDKTGAFAIPMKYDVGWSFSEGVALVGMADGDHLKLSYIDQSGKEVISVPYKMVNPRFTDGLTFFGIEKDGSRKYGFIDKQGKVVIEPVYDKAEEIASSSAKNLGQVLAYKVKKGGLWGLVSGNIHVKPAFSEISAFHEGLAAAAITKGEQQKFGFIDVKGNWVIQPEYDAANDFSHGLAAVRKGALVGGLWGYVDAKGREVIKPQFRFAYNFIGEIALVLKDNKKLLINREGKTLIDE